MSRDVRRRRWHWRPVDALVGQRLVIQLDGFARHGDAALRGRDIDADVRLRLRGYNVVRFDYHQVFFLPDLVADIVRTALAQRRHRFD
jgi:very-short-patch-repair endonuclease